MELDHVVLWLLNSEFLNKLSSALLLESVCLLTKYPFSILPKIIIYTCILVVHRSSETLTNQSNVSVQSDDQFLSLVVDSDCYC